MCFFYLSFLTLFHIVKNKNENSMNHKLNTCITHRNCRMTPKIQNSVSRFSSHRPSTDTLHPNKEDATAFIKSNTADAHLHEEVREEGQHKSNPSRERHENVCRISSQSFQEVRRTETSKDRAVRRLQRQRRTYPVEIHTPRFENYLHIS